MEQFVTLHQPLAERSTNKILISPPSSARSPKFRLKLALRFHADQAKDHQQVCATRSILIWSHLFIFIKLNVLSRNTEDPRRQAQHSKSLLKPRHKSHHNLKILPVSTTDQDQLPQQLDPNNQRFRDKIGLTHSQPKKGKHASWIEGEGEGEEDADW